MAIRADGLAQNHAGPKLALFFLAKNIAARPSPKSERAGPNCLIKPKKLADRSGKIYFVLASL